MREDHIFYAEFNRFKSRVFHCPRLVAIPRFKSLVCSTILPIDGKRRVGFISFSRVLALCEIQTDWFRNWTRVNVFISYGVNYYTKSTTNHSIRIGIKNKEIITLLYFVIYVDWHSWNFCTRKALWVWYSHTHTHTHTHTYIYIYI